MPKRNRSFDSLATIQTRQAASAAVVLARKLREYEAKLKEDAGTEDARTTRVRDLHDAMGLWGTFKEDFAESGPSAPSCLQDVVMKNEPETPLRELITGLWDAYWLVTQERQGVADKSYVPSWLEGSIDPEGEYYSVHYRTIAEAIPFISALEDAAQRATEALGVDEADEEPTTKRHPLEELDQVKEIIRRGSVGSRALKALLDSPEWRISGTDLKGQGITKARVPEEAARSAYHRVKAAFEDAGIPDEIEYVGFDKGSRSKEPAIFLHSSRKKGPSGDHAAAVNQ